ncbi:MAG: hypothetical protein IJW73_01505 [Candidatus Gastranaerophilales bacterium]|nr:hypothetical protein [Candidatus Gastranaerophilales bacterium]
MSNEVSNANTSKASMGSYALMPSIYVGVNMINNTRHFKNPFNPLKGVDVSKFKEVVKGADFDTFQKAQFSSESFEAIRSANISAQKATKKLSKLQAKQAKIAQSGKIGIKDTIFNIFRKQENKITKANIDTLVNNAKTASDTASGNITKINDALKTGNAKQLQSTLEGLNEGYANSMNFIKGIKSGQGAVKSFGSQVFSNFKKEFSFKKGNRFNAGFNIAMTALQFIPNLFQKVAPAFKNNGFKAGMTELGQTIVQAGADLVGYAAGGAVGRTLGSAVGTIFGPMGTFIGGLVGDMVGSMFVGSKVCGVVEKVTNKDDFKNTGNIELASQEEQAQIMAAQNMQQPQTNEQVAVAQNTQPTQTQTEPVAQEKTTQNKEASQENLAQKYANFPSRSEVKRMAYAQAFQSNKNKNLMNSYYA